MVVWLGPDHLKTQSDLSIRISGRVSDSSDKHGEYNEIEFLHPGTTTHTGLIAEEHGVVVVGGGVI